MVLTPDAGSGESNKSTSGGNVPLHVSPNKTGLSLFCQQQNWPLFSIPAAKPSNGRDQFAASPRR